MDETVIQEHARIYRRIVSLSSISLACGILSILSQIAITLFRGDPPEDIFVAEMAVIAVVSGVAALLKIHKYPKLISKTMAIAGVACGGVITLYILIFCIVIMFSYIF
jgi:hypothetical protein